MTREAAWMLGLRRFGTTGRGGLPCFANLDKVALRGTVVLTLVLTAGNEYQQQGDCHSSEMICAWDPETGNWSKAAYWKRAAAMAADGKKGRGAGSKRDVGGNWGETKGTPDDPDNPDPSSSGELRYAPTRKHEKGGWGTEMDLNYKQGSEALNNSVEAGKQRYAYYNGRLYEFQPDNTGGWHGYPIRGNEAPTSALRQLLRQESITKAEYSQLIKGK